MLGNFEYCNPTKLYFGEESLGYLDEELKNYGTNILLVYGGGSIKKNGIYNDVIRILKANNKNIAEVPGVMPNPTVEKLYEGVEISRKNQTDLILAVAVITNHSEKLKIGHVFADVNVMPRFSILNPKYTMTLPKYQMVSGIYDIMNHICEQYFSGDDDNTSDYISEGLMRSLIHASRIALANPDDYEARSNIMWTATWALNTLVAKGKSTDWMVHMLGQAVGAFTDATHGMTLAAVSLPYYRYIMPYGIEKFKKFAINVWSVNPAGMSDEQIAQEGIAAMEKWMKELGLVMNITELGATEEMLDGLVEATIILPGGYKVLEKEEIKEIFRMSY